MTIENFTEDEHVKKDREFYTTGQVAEIFGVNFRTVIRWIQRGILQAHRLPGRGDHRISSNELARFAAENKQSFQTSTLSPKTEAARLPVALVIDDEPAVAQAISRALKSLHMTVEVAHDGFTGGFLLHKLKPNILTLDLKMEKIDGFDVLRIVKSHPDLKHTKVIIISGDTQENLSRANDVGADAVLSKPYTRAELANTVEKLLK